MDALLTTRTNAAAYARNARWVVVLLGLSEVVSLLSTRSLALANGVWQLWVVVGVLGAYAVGTFGCGVLIWRGRITLGIQVLLVLHWLLVFAVGTLMLNLGLPLAIAGVLLPLMIASQTLPEAAFARVVLTSTTLTVLLLVLDLVLPSGFRYAPPPALEQGMLSSLLVLLVVFAVRVGRQFLNYGLRTKFIITFLTLSLMPIAIISIVNDRGIRDSLINGAGQTLQGLALSHRQAIAGIMQRQTVTLQALTLNDNIRVAVGIANRGYTVPPATIRATLLQRDAEWQQAGDNEFAVRQRIDNALAKELRTYQIFPANLQLFITDQYGGLIGATSRPPRAFYGDEAWWQAAWNNGAGAVHYTPLRDDATLGQPVLGIALPLRNREGTTEGVVYCACGLAAIDAYLSNVNASGPSSTELLVSPTEVFRPGEGIVSVDPALLTEMRLARAEFGQFGGTARPRMVSYQPLVSNVDEPNLALDGLGWGVASSQSVTTALAPNALRPKFALLAAVILAALLAPASYFIASQTAAPITRLTAVAMAVAAGNLQAKVPVETNDEIGVLATTFNDMTERLQLTLQTLERRVIERTQALEASLYDNERALLRLQANELEREGLLRQARKRAVELETVARVSADASRLLDVEQLLDAVVNLTKGSFGLYHAQIYLLTPAKDVLKMAAGAGEVGRALVTQGYAIAVNHPQALVAEAVRTQHLVVVNDVAAVLHFLPHPLLPDTHSEMAIPLIVGNTVLGVFDVQADTIGFFTSEEQRIQTVLATQIAVAVQNALLYAEQASTLAQLREVDQMKSSFLANMSHELRTPLNSILGFAEVMLEGIDGPLNELLHHDIQIIHRNGRHLLALISDILDMAKIESGTLRLQPEQLDLADLVLEALSTATPLARQKALTLTFAPPAAPVLVKVDHARLRQVLLNLVSNAIKFTETGGITLDIKMHTSVVQLRVRDTGLGIPSSQHESIFEPFHQVDTSLTRKAGGTGLGLAISRYLVGMHSGRLWVESTGVAHEGACFILELPVLHDTEASHGII